MFYEFSAETPANTPETSFVETRMKLTAGIIHHVELDFPAGCEGLAHAKIYQGGVQIWPSNLSGNLTGNFFPIAFNEFKELKPGENELVMRTWNTDTRHAHTITIRMALLREKELFPELELADLIRLLFRTLQRR